MDMLLGLVPLAGFSLLGARLLKRPSALMPLVTVAVTMLWFTLLGTAGLLQVAGWVWYLAGAAALVLVLVWEKRAVLRLFSPGLIFFLAGSVFFIVLLYCTQPLLTHWDEFTFWGPAAKATTNAGELYTTAASNLIPRSYPPGLTVFSYALQFFGGTFAEYKLFAAYAILYLATFATAAALPGKNKTGAVVLLGTFFLLPLLFETLLPAGQTSTSYIIGMSDPALAALFGGARCLYFGGGNKDARLLLPFGLVLAALTNIKDIGLALALLALLIAAADMFFCERDTLSFFRLKRWKGWLAACAVCLAMIVAIYLVWALHIGTALDVDRFDLGSSAQQRPMTALLGDWVRALFGIEVPQQYSVVNGLMWRALVSSDYPVWLLGPGIRVFIVILVVLVLAWLLCGTGRGRRRVVVFAVASAVGFLAFYLFNIFTYAFIFAEVEAYVLKDYNRYITPYWLGWLMASLVLLAANAGDAQREAALARTRTRSKVARVLLVGFAACVLFTTVYHGRFSSGVSNFLQKSPSLYTTRQDVQQLVTEAKAEGMQPGDTVYLINQDDDGTRFYMLGYELDARLAPVFGRAWGRDGQPLLNEDDSQKIQGKAAGKLVPTLEGYSALENPVVCTPDELAAYLRDTGCTHLLLDALDAYILESFGPLFTDGLETGWTPDGWNVGGQRYYRIEWQGDDCTFVPAAAPEGGAAP